MAFIAPPAGTGIFSLDSALAPEVNRRPGSTVGPGRERRWLDRGGRRKQTELAQLVQLVEVDTSLSDLSVFDAKDLDSVTDDFLVGRRNRAGRGVQGSSVRSLHDDLLDNPG